jgi:hypothetical protein
MFLHDLNGDDQKKIKNKNSRQLFSAPKNFSSSLGQGCQMVQVFSNQKIQIWVNFGGSCNGRWVYFMDIWFILWTFGVFCGNLVCIFYEHLVYFVVIWYIYPFLVRCTKKESGNPALGRMTEDHFPDQTFCLQQEWRHVQVDSFPELLSLSVFV